MLVTRTEFKSGIVFKDEASSYGSEEVNEVEYYWCEPPRQLGFFSAEAAQEIYTIVDWCSQAFGPRCRYYGTWFVDDRFRFCFYSKEDSILFMLKWS